MFKLKTNMVAWDAWNSVKNITSIENVELEYVKSAWSIARKQREIKNAALSKSVIKIMCWPIFLDALIILIFAQSANSRKSSS